MIKSIANILVLISLFCRTVGYILSSDPDYSVAYGIDIIILLELLRFTN